MELLKHARGTNSFINSRGAEPKQLTFSAALGVTLGVFPICGTLSFNRVCAVSAS